MFKMHVISDTDNTLTDTQMVFSRAFGALCRCHNAMNYKMILSTYHVLSNTHAQYSTTTNILLDDMNLFLLVFKYTAKHEVKKFKSECHVKGNLTTTTCTDANFCLKMNGSENSPCQEKDVEQRHERDHLVPCRSQPL